MSFSQLDILTEFVEAAIYANTNEGHFANYISVRLEQRREAVRRYRDRHREEYRARDRERWQRRQERKRSAV